ncbi:hypothetical protein HPB48_001836 [Haemaphysalis longicornis]|uniref:Uncharacterized protein n=1 Tax=Haemaphysalis longicornis TaxID=44386 RepID=A0A9J6G4V3_HAELO|nr:hypothetical protein HPB48_001836 [Haemaphysalis longicornis]
MLVRFQSPGSDSASHHLVRAGAGYHMVIVKQPTCDTRAVMDVIAAFAPSTELESNVGSELALRIARQDQPSFKHLFKHLEEHKQKLGIAGFGVSVTTLEEVFLRYACGKYSAEHCCGYNWVFSGQFSL